jgi:hypothetical protein
VVSVPRGADSRTTNQRRRSRLALSGPGTEASTITAQGHPRTALRRALERGNLVVAEIEAREVGQLDLGEALELTALVALRDRERGRGFEISRGCLGWSRMKTCEAYGREFLGFGSDRFRTALSRACTAAAVPAFSPHDLRHRRISLLHLGGTPWARIGEHVGQRNLATTANTYTHVMSDEVSSTTRN